MVLPLIGLDILQLLLVDVAAAEIHDEEALGMAFLEEFCDHVDGVSVQLLYAGSWEGHRDYSVGDVGQVEVVAVLFEAVLRATNYLAE